jgi:hypothetical protein
LHFTVRRPYPAIPAMRDAGLILQQPEDEPAVSRH